MDIDLKTLNNNQGFKVSGAVSGDNSGKAVASAFSSDIMISSPLNRNSFGAAYVIYGKDGGYPDIDLISFNSAQGFRILGASSGDQASYALSNIGDFNNDSLTDILISAPFASPFSKTSAGISYVIYGKKDGYHKDIDLSKLDVSYGFRIFGANSGDQTGFAISGDFDINYDNISDVVIGAPNSAYSGRDLVGVSYVVYGVKGSYTDIDLSSTFDNTQGFKVIGNSSNEQSGSVLSNAGDINSDGIGDIIIGVPKASFLDRNLAGVSYVIYGVKGGYLNDIDLNLWNNKYGFRIFGADSSDASGFAVSGGFDINGDGIGDIIIGANNASPPSRSHAGTTYVIYGRKGGYSDIDLKTFNSTYGFKILGANPGDLSGTSVNKAGDIDADGIDDIVIGASQASPLGRSLAGESYVIFGKKGQHADIDLAQIGVDGFRIMGASAGDKSGKVVNTVGDINKDGIADIGLGAPDASPFNRGQAGLSYVIYGSSTFQPTATPVKVHTESPIHTRTIPYHHTITPVPHAPEHGNSLPIIIGTTVGGIVAICAAIGGYKYYHYRKMLLGAGITERVPLTIQHGFGGEELSTLKPAEKYNGDLLNDIHSNQQSIAYQVLSKAAQMINLGEATIITGDNVPSGYAQGYNIVSVKSGFNFNAILMHELSHLVFDSASYDCLTLSSAYQKSLNVMLHGVVSLLGSLNNLDIFYLNSNAYNTVQHSYDEAIISKLDPDSNRTLAEREHDLVQYYLPQIVAAHSLNAEEIYFLERAADYVNGLKNSKYSDGVPGYDEMLARCVEMQVAGISEALRAFCQPIEEAFDSIIL